MGSISIDELEQKVDAGEEVIDRYFDASTTRIGTPRAMTARRLQISEISPLDLPLSMIEELDRMANELCLSRQAVMTMMLRRALDEHYLAKRSLN